MAAQNPNTVKGRQELAKRLALQHLDRGNIALAQAWLKASRHVGIPTTRKSA
jgi:hypothetical protein